MLCVVPCRTPARPARHAPPSCKAPWTMLTLLSTGPWRRSMVSCNPQERLVYKSNTGRQVAAENVGRLHGSPKGIDSCWLHGHPMRPEALSSLVTCTSDGHNLTAIHGTKRIVQSVNGLDHLQRNRFLCGSGSLIEQMTVTFATLK